MSEKRLYRSCNDRVLGGVAAGVAEYFGFDTGVTRLVFALVMITTGFGFLAYLLAWVILPVDPKCKTKTTGADEIKGQAEKAASDIRKAASEVKYKREDITMWVGVFVLFLGVLFLTQSIFGVHLFRVFWPAWLILIGAFIVINSLNKK